MRDVDAEPSTEERPEGEGEEELAQKGRRKAKGKRKATDKEAEAMSADIRHISDHMKSSDLGRREIFEKLP